MKKSILTFFTMIVLSLPLHAQTVYLPATHEVYKFLDEMAAKQIIGDYRDAVKPLSRQAIAKFLIRIDSLRSQLTPVDLGRLKFYKEEFYQELKSLNETSLPDERWHLYGYQSDPTQVVVDVIGSASENRMADGKRLSETTNGIFGYGYVGNNVGAYFYYHDSHDGGSYVSSAGTSMQSVASFRPLTPLTAAVITNPGASASSFDYDVFNAQVNFDLGFVTLTAEQMQNVWGSGENGNIIQSTKAPAFPQLTSTDGFFRESSIRRRRIIPSIGESVQST